MRQEQERFRSHPLNRGVDTNPPGRRSHIDTLGEPYRFYRHSGEERIENSRENREEEVPRKTYVQKPDGFEPFINQEPQENNLFVNLYGGNYSQKMELNRVGVERVLKIAHLEGKVSLSTLAPSRSRGEAQGNELAAKRFVLFEKRTQKAEENPYKRVLSVPEGWRIEINDQRITEELTEKRLGGENLQKEFIGRFNGLVRDGIGEAVRREKLSNEKDKNFWWKVIVSSANPTIGLYFSAQSKFDPVSVAAQVGAVLFIYSFFNIASKLYPRYWLIRNIDHPLEYLMPRVEIDKVGRTFGYLMPVIGRGRTLVREVGEKVAPQ